jgi:hypothetical protein
MCPVDVSQSKNQSSKNARARSAARSTPPPPPSSSSPGALFELRPCVFRCIHPKPVPSLPAHMVACERAASQVLSTTGEEPAASQILILAVIRALLLE